MFAGTGGTLTMKSNAPSANDDPSATQDQLCALLLEIVGKNPGRMRTAQRHARVLDAAISHMNAEQRTEACRRIRALETKWGPLLPGNPATYNAATENLEILPEQRVARWLSTRKNPERLLPVLHRAAVAVWDGEISSTKIMDQAYANEVDRVVHTVGYDSFREWLLELRIASWMGKAGHRPGSLCQWWVEEMKPTKRNDTSYTACLTQLLELKANRSG